MTSRPAVSSLLPVNFTPAQLPWRLRLGALDATLRWLEPADRDRLLEFFTSHTEETVYQRYGYAGVRMTPERAAQLVGVDQTRDAALGVIERHRPYPRLIAIGRYCLAADARSAEVAFVVHERRRGLGLGTVLLHALIAIARERGLEQLVAEVQHGNAPMLAMLRAAGAQLEWPAGASTLTGTLRLSPVAASPDDGTLRLKISSHPRRQPLHRGRGKGKTPPLN
jgi:GNAT superfamily N-acetyltransferase